MLDTIRRSTVQVLLELQDAAQLAPDQLLVIGASSSEVAGRKIGTAGSTEIAAAIVDAVLEVQSRFGFHLAFQCCEHLNRALVMTRDTAKTFGLDRVSVVPVPKAGGSVAAVAFRRLPHPVVVESVQADAGVDIGDTLIGMHLRPVAVPVRPTVKQIGEAHVTMARTRPKLIGGSRAVYELDEAAADSAGSNCT